MKQMKRIIGILLSIVLFFGTIPMSAEAALGGRDWRWPVPASNSLSSCYLDGRSHYALDISAGGGSSIYASYPGTVIYTYTGCGYDYGKSSSCPCGSCGDLGNSVFIKHSYNGVSYVSRYGHLRSVKVSVGQTVTKDSVIGTVGSTGYSSGNHLDFRIYKGTTTSHVAARDSIDSFKDEFLEMPAGLNANAAGTACCYTYVSEVKAQYAGSIQHVPKGSYDAISGGENCVGISGWAYDPDNIGEQVYVHVYIDGKFAGELFANAYRPDVNNVFGCGNYHGFSGEIPYNVSSSGEHTVEVYALDLTYGAQSTYLGSKTATITQDATPPIVSNIMVDVDSEGYTVTCKVSDNIGVVNVKFPTWPLPDGSWQPVWHEGTISRDIAICRINISDHGNIKNIDYATHIYAYDAAGNIGKGYCEWTYIGDIPPAIIEDEYNGSKYKVYDSGISWVEAEEFCEKQGGHLVTITSAEEQVFVQSLLETGASKNQYWIGGKFVDDVFTWVTGEDTDYTNWNTNEPSRLGYEGEVENYVQMYNNAQANEKYKWNDMYVNNYVPNGDDFWGIRNVGFIYEEEHQHEYTSEIEKEENCIEEGVRVYFCACGERYTESIAATGHMYETVVTAPGCEEKGYSTHICQNCLDSYVDNETVALGHKLGNWTTMENATCENTGSEKRVCDRCSYTEIRTTVATGHTYETVVTAPSCTEKGYSTHTCKTCGKSYTDSEKATLGHKYGSWTTVKAATCEVVGSEKRVCERCSNTETRSVAAKGHAYETVVTAPGCETTGYSTHICKTCGKSYTDSEKAALGHKYGSWTTVKAATCENAGSEKRVCERCSNTETRSVAAKGHAYETVVTAPGCETTGYSIHTCKICGKSYTDSEKAALGHKYGSWTTVKAATCENAGSEKRVCERCSNTETRSVEAKGHTYETVVTAPSCTEKGYSTHTCKNCEDSYTDNEKEALGHKYGNWTTVKSATCESTGSEKRVCERCSNTETRSVEAKGHTYETVVTAPGCETTGYSTHTCKICGDSYTDGTTDALGHKLGNWTTVKEATCEEGGSEIRSCERCDYEEIQKTAVADHKYKKVTTLPTCEESGYTTYTCKVCGYCYDGDEKEALGHSFTNYISDNNATEDFPGTKTAKCDRCNATDTIPETSEEVPENPESKDVIRLAGSTRYDTGYAVADVLKETLGVDKFEAVVVATGKNFADALAGSYLAVQKNAPIILTSGKADNVAQLHEYIKDNVCENGTVYILGGEAAVPESVEDISGYTVKRLAGSSRYDTNLEILLEAGIPGDEIIVATGKSFADSLSASAAKLPILLVKPNATLDIAQKALLKNMNKIYIVGGEGAVSSAYETELAAYGMVERVFGSSRYDTSVEIAKAFSGSVDKIVVASGKNFPDGLCGGPLAAALNVPLILTRDNGADAAMEYAEENAVVGGYVLGGTGALTDDTVVDVFKLQNAQEIK